MRAAADGWAAARPVPFGIADNDPTTGVAPDHRRDPNLVTVANVNPE
jgi:hypothetical protein